MLFFVFSDFFFTTKALDFFLQRKLVSPKPNYKHPSLDVEALCSIGILYGFKGTRCLGSDEFYQSNDKDQVWEQLYKHSKKCPGN